MWYSCFVFSGTNKAGVPQTKTSLTLSPKSVPARDFGLLFLFMHFKVSTIEFYKRLRQEGVLTDFILFGNIKFRKIIDGKDKNGGFIKRSQIKSIASELGINYNTFRKGIAKLINLGWLIPTETGYRLVGHRILFDTYGSDLGIKRLCIHAKTKKELNKQIGISLIKNNLKTQLFRAYNGKTKNWKKNRISNFLADDRFTMSVRKMSEYLGYKSPMSSTRLQKKLEADKLLKVERKVKRICTAEEYSLVLKADDRLQKRCFIAGGDVYLRLCNNLIPLI